LHRVDVRQPEYRVAASCLARNGDHGAVAVRIRRVDVDIAPGLAIDGQAGAHELTRRGADLDQGAVAAITADVDVVEFVISALRLLLQRILELGAIPQRQLVEPLRPLRAYRSGPARRAPRLRHDGRECKAAARVLDQPLDVRSLACELV